MEFILKHTIYEIDKIPKIENPQIPVAGRSNVGKSSFINCILGQKNLAKTSSKPGKTRSINFYFIKKFKGYLVDLPGYGYAKTSKRQRQKWATLVDNYFKKNAENIKGVILLIDSRLPPQQADINLFNYIMDQGFKVIPILTKEDKSNMSAKNRIKNFWQDFSGSTIEPIFFSAKTSKGKGKIINILMETLKS